ncbi:MAG: hypothetical protein MUE81_20495 [Thermoflexibacter sp.]|jgi:hypothetical protein|nr:hypothetical protein [Thermoflexibacter sp.]
MNQTEHIQTLTEIRNLMERSSRFLSLSGLSGVSVGVCACIGFFVLKFYWNLPLFSKDTLPFNELEYRPFVIFILTDAFVVLLSAIIFAIYFTHRKAKKTGMALWDKSAHRLVINLAIPLFAGGIFSFVMYWHHIANLIPAVTLIFYGMALLNASKYTLHDIRALGIGEIILGLIASFIVGYGLLFWFIGFGILHIIYGVIMYFKYER